MQNIYNFRKQWRILLIKLVIYFRNGKQNANEAVWKWQVNDNLYYDLQGYDMTGHCVGAGDLSIDLWAVSYFKITGDSWSRK